MEHAASHHTHVGRDTAGSGHVHVHTQPNNSSSHDRCVYPDLAGKRSTQAPPFFLVNCSVDGALWAGAHTNPSVVAAYGRMWLTRLERREHSHFSSNTHRNLHKYVRCSCVWLAHLECREDDVQAGEVGALPEGCAGGCGTDEGDVGGVRASCV